jgi:Polyketide cyclase / dehydrase and lipid transport
MARYVTRIESRLSPADAFAYMADFANARVWDPSVSAATRTSDGPVALGSTFHLVSRFAGRDVPLDYTIVAYEPAQRVVLEARKPGFVSRDTITFEPAATGSVVSYDALLELAGARRLFDPLLQRIFNGVGGRATKGMQAALNP